MDYQLKWKRPFVIYIKSVVNKLYPNKKIGVKKLCPSEKKGNTNFVQVKKRDTQICYKEYSW